MVLPCGCMAVPPHNNKLARLTLGHFTLRNFTNSPPAPMAEITKKSGPLALLTGFGLFLLFEIVAYHVLRFATSGLGVQDQLQPENTIVSNWVKTVVFLLLHLALDVVAVLVLSNRMPRRHRGQLMGWFYLSLLTGFLLLWPLFNP
jgi:hypothetical protein